MNATFQPLLAALRQNMPPDALAAFLEYARCQPWPPDPDVDASEWEAPELDGEPDFSDPVDGSPEDVDQRIDDALYGETTSPAITIDSETPEVAAWCRMAGLNASVVGQWVWCDPHLQATRTPAEVAVLMEGTGFKFSPRRQSYFHACTVSCRRQPGDKRRGGKLERFHNTASVRDYNPQTFSAAPIRRKQRRTS